VIFSQLREQGHGKDRQNANMGLFCIFEYRNEKGGFVADFGLRGIFYLLHSLGPVFRKPGLGCKDIPDRRLELVRDDGPCYVLVLDKFKVNRQTFWMGRYRAG
jgi:hypothetical protein